MSLYPHPFSAAYWRDAARELRDLRKLTFAALMIALCVVLGHIPSVPLFGGAKITWGFLARALCALVCGPVLGVVFGFSEDILSFFLTGGGGYPFFPGGAQHPAGVPGKAADQYPKCGAGLFVVRHPLRKGLVCHGRRQLLEKPHHAPLPDSAAGGAVRGAAAGTAEGRTGPPADGGEAPLVSGKTAESGGQMPAVFAGGKPGDGGKTGPFCKSSKTGFRLFTNCL